MPVQFGSIVIKGFGFTTLNTLLVQMISVAYQAVFVIVGTVGSTYFRNARTYFMAFNLAIALTGAIMIREISAANIWARFAGYWYDLSMWTDFENNCINALTASALHTPPTSLWS